MASKLDTWKNLKQPVFEEYDCFTCKYKGKVLEIPSTSCMNPDRDLCVSWDLDKNNLWEWNGTSYEDNPE